MKFTSVILLCFLLIAKNEARIQSAGVKGKVTCDGKPAVGIIVKLQDHDSKHITSSFG